MLFACSKPDAAAAGAATEAAAASQQFHKRHRRRVRPRSARSEELLFKKWITSTETPDGWELTDCITFHARESWAAPNESDAEPPEHLAVPSRLVANSPALAREAALAGLGIARLPTFLCAADVQAGSLVALFGRRKLTLGAVQAVYASRRQVAAKVRKFIELLVARFRPSPPW